MFKKTLLAATATFALTGAAQGQIAVSIWTNQTAAATNATLAQALLLGSPTATTNVSAFNFNSAVGGYTVGGFLNNPSLPSGVATAGLNNTYMLFTGQVFLNAGLNSFQVAHDDGLQLSIDGISGLVVDQPGPTAPTLTPFNVNAPSSGLYNFHLAYGECCGAPAQLIWNINGQNVGSVPEPATWAMMLLGFGGIGFAVRYQRRRRSAVPQLS